MKRSTLNENTLPPNPYIDTSIKCALIGANETFLQTLLFSNFPHSPGLSELPSMTPILFWMEGNSSTNFGLANYLQQLGWVFKETSPFFWPFFFQTCFTNYQPHSRTCNPSSPFYIFCEPNILVSSVSKNNTHNSISSTIACSIVPHHKFHESSFDNNNHAKFAFS
jgi:hypothetical protein